MNRIDFGRQCLDEPGRSRDVDSGQSRSHVDRLGDGRRRNQVSGGGTNGHGNSLGNLRARS